MKTKSVIKLDLKPEAVISWAKFQLLSSDKLAFCSRVNIF